MAMHASRTRRPFSASASLLAGAAALLAIAGTCRCVEAQSPAPPSFAMPAGFSGRHFGGMTLPLSLQEADFAVGAARVFAWTESAPVPGSADASGVVQRLLLQGDVRVDIGGENGYHLTAAQAVIWIQTLGVAADNPDAPIRQVAIYFDRVSDPAAEAGVAIAADRLLITGVLRGTTDTGVSLKADTLTRARPTQGDGVAFLAEGEQRLSRYLRTLSVEQQPTGVPGQMIEQGMDLAPGDVLQPAPGSGWEGQDTLVPPVYAGTRLPTSSPSRIRPGLSRPYEPDSPLAQQTYDDPSLAAVGQDPDSAQLAPPGNFKPIFADQGVISFSTRGMGPEAISLIPGEDESVALISGGVVIQYSAPYAAGGIGNANAGNNLQISAQRAVVFLDGGTVMDLAAAPADKVRGFYLEGDVIATDGKYTLRSPKVYYDVRANKAVLIDAVFVTYDDSLKMPLYVRAKSIRQEAQNQFTAEKATLATTEFFDPMFSLGSSTVTVRQVPAPPAAGVSGETRTYVDARDLTMRMGPVPFFYWPRFGGEINDIPLQSLRFESSSNSGAVIETGWDLFGLTGVDKPEGFESTLLLDIYFERGLGIGNKSMWESEEAKGNLLLYSLPADYGEDSLTSGAEKGRDHEFRGIALGEHRWEIDEKWTLFLEGAYVSDENFVDAFFDEIAEEGRELTNAAYLRRLEDNTAFTTLVKGELNDFTSNEYLLQSQGYNVDKVPEFGYFRLGDDILDFLSYSSEYRASRMYMNFTEPTADELGFDTIRRAEAAFGLAPGESLGDRLRAQGYTEDEVLRFDTRHELAAPLHFGPVNVTPFVVGRFTAYDRDFSEFSSDADEQARLWYAGGVRVATSFSRVDNGIDNRLFDLHRIRHIITPSITAWSAGANLDQNDLPVYDDEVESLATGSAIRLGIEQVWQTQRGGPGRYRSVDVFKLNTDFVFSTDDVDQESPIGRFFDYRPEYSLLGDYFLGSAIWQATDAVSIAGSMVYDLDLSQPARTTAGVLVQHTPDFSTFGEVRYINARDVTYILFGASYELTRRYSVGASTTYDSDEEEFQSFNVRLRRKFESAALTFRLSHDTIEGETSLGVVFQPFGYGLEGSADQLSEVSR